MSAKAHSRRPFDRAPTSYTGTYAGIPELCHLGAAGTGGYFYYGIWDMERPGAGAAYPAMKTAITGARGTRVAFVTRSYPGLQWIDISIEPIP